MAQSHTPQDCCVRFAVVIAVYAATLATGRALPLTRAGLSPAGTRQLSWRTKGRHFQHLVQALSPRGWRGLMTLVKGPGGGIKPLNSRSRRLAKASVVRSSRKPPMTGLVANSGVGRTRDCADPNFMLYSPSADRNRPTATGSART